MRSAPRTTGDLCEHFAASLDRCTVMQHLGVLERAELVIAVREGRTRWNHLNAAPFADIYERWINPFATQTLGRMARLKKELEA